MGEDNPPPVFEVKMESIVPQYENIKVTLEWPLVCKLACQALCANTDFERLIQMYLQARLQHEANK